MVGETEKRAAFRIAHAALAKSGTVTLELALSGVPMVTAYRTGAAEAWILRKAIKVTDLLTPRSPNRQRYPFSGLEARRVLGELERKRGELDASAKLLGESVEELKKVLVTSPRNRFMRGMLGRHARSLALTLKEQGKTDEADEMNKLADEMTPPKP